MDKNQILQIISQYLTKINPEISKLIPVNISELFSSQKLKELVINGRWDDILNILSSSKGNEIVEKSIFKIIEQKIYETLSEGNQTLALELLRKELTPLNENPEKIHRIAQNILLMKPERIDSELLAQELIYELKMVPGLMITENRLEELFQQAFEYQKLTNCQYHFEKRKINIDLWSDHDCQIRETIVLEPADVESEIISINTTMDILMIMMLKDGMGGLLCFDDNGEIFVFEKDGNGGWKYEMKFPTLLESMTIWPKSIEKFPFSLKLGQILFSKTMTPDMKNSKTNELSLESPLAIAFLPNQNFVLCSTEDQTTILFDLNQGIPIHSWIRLRCSHILTPSKEDEKYFLAAADNGDILQISTETFQVIKTIPSVHDKVQISSIDLDGKRLLVGCNDSTIYYYDNWMNYSHPTRIFRGHLCKKYQIAAVLSRHDHNIIISTSENGSIYVWNISSGRLLFQIKIFPENCCVNDILEVEPRRFICCGDGGKLYQFKL